MNKIVFTLIVLLGFSCFSNKQKGKGINIQYNQSVISDHVANRIVDEIGRLPEIQKKANYVDSITNGEKGISLIIEADNDTVYDYYVKVGYNNESRFETFFHLYVDTLDYQINIQDYLLGDIITFDTWRAREHNKF